MTVTKCCLALTLCSLVQFAKADFKQDRQAILKMAGTFKIEFTFAETVFPTARSPRGRGAIQAPLSILLS